MVLSPFYISCSHFSIVCTPSAMIKPLSQFGPLYRNSFMSLTIINYFNIKRKAMKKQFFSLLATVLFLTVSTASFGQDQQPSTKFPKWLSRNGYWVVESNVKTPKKNTIYFYATDNTMVYKETVDGVRLHLNRTKTLMRLKGVLDQSVTAWQQQHVSKENQMLVATAFRR